MSGTSKGILIGCGVAGVVGLALLVCCGGLAWWTMRDGVDWIAGVVREQQLNLEAVERWEPPAEDAEPDDVFPEQLGEFIVQGRDRDAAIEAFNLDIPGYRASYENHGQRIELFVYRVNELEREGVFGRIEDGLEASDFRFRRRTGPAHLRVNDVELHFLAYLVRPPVEQGLLWWCKGWLIFLRTDEADLELEPLVRDFLRP